MGSGSAWSSAEDAESAWAPGCTESDAEDEDAAGSKGIESKASSTCSTSTATPRASPMTLATEVKLADPKPMVSTEDEVASLTSKQTSRLYSEDAPHQHHPSEAQDVNSVRLSMFGEATSAVGLPVEEFKLRKNKHGHGGSTRYLRPLSEAPGTPEQTLRRTLSDPTGFSEESLESFGDGSMQDDIDVYQTGQQQYPPLDVSQHKPVMKHYERSQPKPNKEHKHKRKKGEITEEHEQYNITYCMMLGIRFSVSRQGLYGPDADPENARRELTTDDFMRVDRIVFSPEGSALTPAHSLQSRFLFKDYSQEVFRRLRAKFGIDDADYLLSLASSYNYIEFITNSKSGQFFFYSNDGHYLIKTQTKGESKFLRQVLPQYYMYMMDHENSLLVRICGMHRIKLAHMRSSLHFVILKSVYGNAASRRIHTVYDLKGSTVGRAAKRHEAVYKDLDLINNGQSFKLGPKKAAFMAQLEKDANFLAELHIMDYSLLVGIHNKLADPNSDRIATLTGQSSRVLGLERAHSRRLSGELPVRSLLNPEARMAAAVSDASSLTSRVIQEVAEEELDEEEDLDDESADGQPAAQQEDACTEDDMTSADGGSHVYPNRAQGDDDAFDEDDLDDDALPPPDSIFSPIDAVDKDGRQSTEIYYFGIIDILQLYNARKRTENILKSIVEGGEAGISAVNPQRYAARFIKFIDAHIE